MPNWYKIITPHIIYPGKVIYRTTFKICTFLIHFSTRRCSWQVQYSWWFPLPWNVTLQCFILFQGQTNSWKYPFNKIYLIHLSFLHLRIPISRTLQFNNPCFKKRLFVYIFPVIFFSIFLNIFKFLESRVVWTGGKASEKSMILSPWHVTPEASGEPGH